VTDDASVAYKASVRRSDRLVQACAIAGVVMLLGWLIVVAHFIWKFW
jgi:hypothetical protein